jgi:hypothetical protein
MDATKYRGDDHSTLILNWRIRIWKTILYKLNELSKPHKLLGLLKI